MGHRTAEEEGEEETVVAGGAAPTAVKRWVPRLNDADLDLLATALRPRFESLFAERDSNFQRYFVLNDDEYGAGRASGNPPGIWIKPNPRYSAKAIDSSLRSIGMDNLFITSFVSFYQRCLSLVPGLKRAFHSTRGKKDTWYTYLLYEFRGEEIRTIVTGTRTGAKRWERTVTGRDWCSASLSTSHAAEITARILDRNPPDEDDDSAVGHGDQVERYRRDIFRWKRRGRLTARRLALLPNR